MKIELLELKRCCFCIPLRYGLLVWGYIKLLTTLVVFLFGAFFMQIYIQLMLLCGYGMLPTVLLGTAFLVFLVVDIGMTVTFLIGGHQKTTKLLRIFYIYSITLLSIVTAIFFVSILHDLTFGAYDEHFRSSDQFMSYGTKVVTKTVTGVLLIGLQAYIILLLRSEINKLKNSCNCDTFRNIEIKDRETGKYDQIKRLEMLE